ncbi:PREDICTED: L-amino-acid oxidase-like [Dipodomys ordii]|uniref:L-amino-acid oxidase n=1 Tax=Dipodomys ordii TaxID=10020 RepID=A0A1S3F4F5_DIPOR|nr:PREDICTED: L-amino-acid oxidase-like [Dipodomys ordii]
MVLTSSFSPAQVVEELKTSSCSRVLEKYDSFSTKEYLIKVGNLSRGAVQMIGDLLNADSGYYEAFTETLRGIISFFQEPRCEMGVGRFSGMNRHCQLLISLTPDQNMLLRRVSLLAQSKHPIPCLPVHQPASLSLLGLFALRFDEIIGGFDQLPQALHQSLVPGTVRLHSPAETVEMSGDYIYVTYRTPDPLWPRAHLTADYLVVATTAKAARLLQFRPPLSLSKEDALRSVHYNSATKVVLACTQRFWERDGIFSGKSSTDRPSRFTYYPGQIFPNDTGVILASYTLDDDSLFFAAMDHSRVVDVVFDDLAAIHDCPREELRALCPYSMVKHWSQDPYAMGGFAFFTPYQYVDYAQELSRPEGRVYFAGEHTALPHGWIDTAIKSGLKAAKSIQEAVDLASTQDCGDRKEAYPKSEL